jgi:hypothetical protein
VLDEVGDEVHHLRVQDRGHGEVLARGGRACKDEDARADDGTDAERRQRPGAERLLQPVRRIFRLGDQLVDGLLREELVGQGVLLSAASGQPSAVSKDSS